MKAIAAISLMLIKNWARSRGGVFFSILFPVMLILIFGSVFGQEKVSYTLYVQNFDTLGRKPTQLSEEFVKALNDTEVLKIKKLDLRVDPEEFIKEHPFESCRVLVIPKGFQENIVKGKEVEIELLGKKGDQYLPLVENTVKTIVYSFNIKLHHNREIINVTQSCVTKEEVKPIDCYVPAILAAFIMTNGIIGVTVNTSEFRRRGIIKRLVATPLSKYEWILGNLLQQVLLAFILTAVMLCLAWLVFDFHKVPNVYSILLIILGAVTFCSLGIFLGGIVKDVEAATGIANAIAFPMMFLSGAFWPVELMPEYLQAVAKLLPLYYLHNGLRMTMIYRKFDPLSFSVLVILASVFIILAVKITKWRS
jgi:ABC-2 type transport system permease protein